MTRVVHHNALLLLLLLLLHSLHVRPVYAQADDGGANTDDNNDDGEEEQEQAQGEGEGEGAHGDGSPQLLHILPPAPKNWPQGLLNPFANAGFPKWADLHPRAAAAGGAKHPHLGHREGTTGAEALNPTPPTTTSPALLEVLARLTRGKRRRGSNDVDEDAEEMETRTVALPVPPQPFMRLPGLLNPFANVGSPALQQMKGAGVHPRGPMIPTVPDKNLETHTRQATQQLTANSFLQLEETVGVGEGENSVAEDVAEHVVPPAPAAWPKNSLNPFDQSEIPLETKLTLGEQRYNDGITAEPGLAPWQQVIAPEPESSEDAFVETHAEVKKQQHVLAATDDAQANAEQQEANNGEEDFVVPLPPIGFPDGYNPFRSLREQGEEKLAQAAALTATQDQADDDQPEVTEDIAQATFVQLGECVGCQWRGE